MFRRATRPLSSDDNHADAQLVVTVAVDRLMVVDVVDFLSSAFRITYAVDG